MDQAKDKEAFEIWWEKEGKEKAFYSNGETVSICYNMTQEAWLNGAFIAKERSEENKRKTDAHNR